MATPKVYVICDNNCKWEGMTKEQILAAIIQAVNEGTIGDIDTGFVQTIKTITGTPLRFFVGTQADYNGLSDSDKQNLFAIITDDATKENIQTLIDGLLQDMSDLDNSVKEFQSRMAMQWYDRFKYPEISNSRKIVNFGYNYVLIKYGNTNFSGVINYDALESVYFANVFNGEFEFTAFARANGNIVVYKISSDRASRTDITLDCEIHIGYLG